MKITYEKSLVVGGNGLVGSAIYKVLSSLNSDCYRTYHSKPPTNHADKSWVKLDLLDLHGMRMLLSRLEPSIIYLCAAYTNVEMCQGNTVAMDINVEGTQQLIKLCAEFGTHVVFFSSSYVFDGTKKTPYKEWDSPRPINDYGLWKMEVEGQVLAYGGLVIRTVGVFGSDDKNFLSQILSLKKYDSLHIPDDQYMNPIWSMDLAKAAIQLSANRDERVTGIMHVAGDTNLSKFDWAKSALIATNRWNEGKVYPSYGTRQIAKRPENGCLDTSLLNSYGIETPNFHKGLLEAATW